MARQTKDTLVRKLLRHLGLRAIESPLGPCYELSAAEAFVISTVTGAAYADSDSWPFSARGLTKIFNKMLERSFVPGLFDYGSIVHGPWELEKVHPFLFEGPKKLLVVGVDSEADFSNTIRRVRRTVSDPTDYLILRIENWKKGGGLEPILEFTWSVVLSKAGYFVENQAPLTAALGSPDLIAFNLNHFTRSASRAGLHVPSSGHLINLLLFSRLGAETLSTFSDPGPGLGLVQLPREKFIACEAKTLGDDFNTRLKKYSRSMVFDGLAGLTDNSENEGDACFWVLGLNNEADLFTRPPSKPRNWTTDVSLQTAYEEWLEKVCLLYLLSGLNPAVRVELLNSPGSPRTTGEFEGLHHLATRIDRMEILASAQM